MFAAACRFLALATSTAALVLAGCGGGGPPDQEPAARDEMVGTATGGDTTGPLEAAGEFAAKGTAGLLRTANVQANSLDYRVSLVQLTGPYALRAVLGDDQAQSMAYSVAPSRGVANITPLTTLLMAQLFGQDPAAIYASYGASGGVDTARVTDANLQAAQARVVAYLGEELGITVPASAGSFLTTPFKAVAGDPMYDTVLAIKAKLADDGTSFQALTTQVAFAARLCLIEKVAITVGGTTADFCPLTKRTDPDANDASVLDHVFENRHGDLLTVRVQGNTVTSASYDTTAGASLACSGTPACAGITLGALADDGTRPITFDHVSLQGTDGNATLTGAFTGATPGIVIPVLPCDTNRFVVIGSDQSVAAQCADPDPFGFGVGGVPGGMIGVETSRGTYDFTAAAGSDPTNARVSVITDGYSGVLAVQFTDEEPDTFLTRRRFICQQSGCNGVTLGPLTINTDFGGPDFPFYVRALNFDNTVLIGVDDEGSPTGETATLRASLSAAYLLPIPPLAYPATHDCAADRFALNFTADGGSFNACVPPGSTTVLGNGDIQLAATSVDDADDKLILVLHQGVVASATLHLSAVPGDFVCSGSCPGITVTDNGGVRTVVFNSAVLAEQFFGAAGTRSITLGGSSLEFAAP